MVHLSAHKQAEGLLCLPLWRAKKSTATLPNVCESAHHIGTILAKAHVLLNCLPCQIYYTQAATPFSIL